MRLKKGMPRLKKKDDEIKIKDAEILSLKTKIDKDKTDFDLYQQVAGFYESLNEEIFINEGIDPKIVDKFFKIINEGLKDL